MLRTHSVALLLLATATPLLFLGCGGGGGSVSSPVTTTRQINGLEITQTAKDSYQRGEPVILTASLKNIGTEPVRIVLGDFTVNNNAQDIWNSYWGGPAALIAPYTLAPGEVVTATATWDQKDYAQKSPVPAGLYTVTAHYAFSTAPQGPMRDAYSVPIAFQIR